MANEQNNTVTLTKSTYDSMRGMNDRASMLLREILNGASMEDDTDELSLDVDRVIRAIEILYPDTYRKKVSALKAVRTKAMMKGVK